MATYYDFWDSDFYHNDLKEIYGNRNNFYRHVAIIEQKTIRTWLISIGCRENL